MSDKKPSVIAVLSGVGVGVAVFVGVNVTIGRAIVPTTESMTGPHLSAPIYPQVAAPAVASTGTYQMVCSTCHQAEGQGVAGAFPPLAGSSWMTADPETPIRIVLLGMSGEVEVNGKTYNAVMPPPPGLSDAQIAEAITFARSNFGNSASAIDAAAVKRVRDSLTGRTQMWTAAELLALRAQAGGGDTPAAPAGTAAPDPSEAAAPVAPAPVAPAPAEPAPAQGAPAP